VIFSSSCDDNFLDGRRFVSIIRLILALKIAAPSALTTSLKSFMDATLPQMIFMDSAAHFWEGDDLGILAQ
jgi:hypothetical protein